MDYVLGIDVYSLNSPDDSTNAGDPLKIDPVTKKNVVDPVKAAANWRAVHDAGVRFAYIKATEYRADTGYANRMQYAREAGLLRGPYMLPHFEFDTVTDQVNLFIQTVGSDQGELPPMLDLESPGGNWPSGRVLLKRVKNCLDQLEKAFKRKPIIYTSQSIVNQFGIADPSWGKAYPLWLASYPYADFVKKLQYSDPNNPPKWSNTYPPQPPGYSPWIIWQWTEKGRLNGMGQENVDINMFKGKYADLLNWAHATEPIPAPVPSQPEPAPEQPSGPPPQPQPDVPPDTSVPDFVLYTVKSGDTLGGIALAYHTTVDAIMALNPQITNRNIIGLGWELKIPTA